MKHKNDLAIKVGTLLLVIMLFIAGGASWWHNAISPVSTKDVSPVLFEVYKGEGVKSIASRLAQDHLIRSSTGFFVLVKLLGIETQIQAGQFRINSMMNAQEIALALTHGTQDIWVTTLEGWRSEEIASKLTKEFDIPGAEFLKYAIEGYMFPDTYLIPRDATAAAIVQLFKKTFDEKVTAQMRKDATKNKLTFQQVITLASIVEREGRTNVDRPIIAGILIKRLQADWPLQADATLQYMLGYQASEKSWWKKDISNEDKKIKSPYNTYDHVGLPPGPIANPGLDSIKAVIYPQITEYWYYIHDETGQAHYAKTIEEHNANIAKYL